MHAVIYYNMPYEINAFWSPPGGGDKMVAPTGIKCGDCHKRFVQHTVRNCPKCHKNMCSSCLSYTQNDKQYKGWCNACIWFDLG